MVRERNVNTSLWGTSFNEPQTTSEVGKVETLNDYSAFWERSIKMLDNPGALRAIHFESFWKASVMIFSGI